MRERAEVTGVTVYALPGGLKDSSDGKPLLWEMKFVSATLEEFTVRLSGEKHKHGDKIT